MAIPNTNSPAYSANQAISTDTRATTVATGLLFMVGFLTCLNGLIFPHLKSIFELTYADMQSVNFKEIYIIDSRVYEGRDFLDTIDMPMRPPLDRIVSDTYQLRDVSIAFQRWSRAMSTKFALFLLSPPGPAAIHLMHSTNQRGA